MLFKAKLSLKIFHKGKFKGKIHKIKQNRLENPVFTGIQVSNTRKYLFCAPPKQKDSHILRRCGKHSKTNARVHPNMFRAYVNMYEC